MNQRKIKSLIKKLHARYPTSDCIVIQKEVTFYNFNNEVASRWGVYVAGLIGWRYADSPAELETTISTLLLP